MPQHVHVYVSVRVKSRVPTINIIPYPECVCVCVCVVMLFVACMLYDLLILLDSVTLIILTAVFHIKSILLHNFSALRYKKLLYSHKATGISYRFVSY